MINNHDLWNEHQKQLNAKNSPIYCNEREIWWCSVGMNIGTEIYGKNEVFERPVVILKVYNKETILILPLTSKTKDGKYYTKIIFNNIESSIILSQVRSISTKRLSRKIGRISKKHFKNIKYRFIKTL